MADLEKYLLEAAKKKKEELSSHNPYRDIGFDGNKKRLGWVKAIPFSKVKKSLEGFLPLLEGKDNFIFVGMGGSINGIKPLVSLFKTTSLFILDNLDPCALLDILSQVKNLEKTLVVAISKSGTTKETQLLALTLKEYFLSNLGPDRLKKHFLWLSDAIAFKKLDSLGWKGIKKVSIQVDGETDIGGRFSSPHTLIFILPLFLLLNKDFTKLKYIYDSFTSLQKEIRNKAYLEAKKYKDKLDAYFSPLTEARLGDSFSSWVVQLFQESLGSKLKTLAVKTIINFPQGIFSLLKLELKINNPLVLLMSQMYFFQVFIAYYSAYKRLNFVTQNFVEKYKQEMQRLEGQSREELNIGLKDLAGIIKEVKKNINRTYRFIEIVLYFYPQPQIRELIKKSFIREFREQQVLLFVGSDWNHHSYQAAFTDKDTFYVLLLSSFYKEELPSVSSDILKRNIKVLKTIAQATHLTLKDKSVLFCLKQ